MTRFCHPLSLQNQFDCNLFRTGDIRGTCVIVAVGFAIDTITWPKKFKYFIKFIDFFDASFVTLVPVEVITVDWIYEIDHFCNIHVGHKDWNLLAGVLEVRNTVNYDRNICLFCVDLATDNLLWRRKFIQPPAWAVFTSFLSTVKRLNYESKI